MAVIGKIRQRAGLAIVVVGFSLVAFILGDLLTSNRSFLGVETNVAVIGGRKVKIQDFEARVQELENIYKLNNDATTIDQSALQQLRDQAWGQLLNEELLVRQLNKAGIVVSEEELFDMVQGRHIHPQIKEAFSDPSTGQFSKANIIQFLKTMDQDQTGRTRAQWLAFEEGIRDERAIQKYNDMIKFGLYATNSEARTMYVHNNRKAVVEYVSIPYSEVPDSAATPTDEQLLAYYNKHKDAYDQDASRHVEYVIFDVAPSGEDRQAAFEYIADLVEPFMNTDEDSNFVAVNADTKPDYGYVKQGMLAPRLDSVMFTAAPGTVVGPYEENGYVKVAKLTDRRLMPDSIKVSHALVAYQGAERAPQGATRTAEEAKAVADSLLELCREDAEKYLDIARNASDDAVAAQQDGDLGWINMGSPMDQRFKAGAFQLGVNEVGVVESNFGFHLIKVFESGELTENVQVMTIDRLIEPGSKTFQAVFAKANEFAGRYNTAGLFDSAVVKQGLNKRVLESLSETDRSVPGLENSRELVRWAFEADEGDVSKAFEFEEKFVVAKLVEIREEGIAPLEQVKEEVTAEVIKDLKGDRLIEQFSKAMEGGADLLAIATKVGKNPAAAENVSFTSPYVANLGMEPAFVAHAMTLKENELSAPFKGEMGVYVIKVTTLNEPAEKTEFAEDRRTKLNVYHSRSTYEVFNALQEKAEVVDNRGKFY